MCIHTFFRESLCFCVSPQVFGGHGVFLGCRGGVFKSTRTEKHPPKRGPAKTDPPKIDPPKLHAVAGGGLFKAPSQKHTLTEETLQKHTLSKRPS